MSPQTVNIGARIGTSSLSLKDFQGLACGDVLVLDRSVEDLVELTINGAPMFPSLVTLEASQDGLSIRFKERPHV